MGCECSPTMRGEQAGGNGCLLGVRAVTRMSLRSPEVEGGCAADVDQAAGVTVGMAVGVGVRDGVGVDVGVGVTAAVTWK
jgi:hypothetical protein